MNAGFLNRRELIVNSFEQKVFFVNPELSIIIPALNEEGNIIQLIERLERVRKKNGLSMEYIVVDNGSEDGTVKEGRKLEKRFKNFRIIPKVLPRGMGVAIKCGIKEARGKIGVVVMADGVDALENIPLFRKEILREGCKLVIGSRYKTPSHSQNISSAYKFWSKVYRVFTRLFMGVPVADVTNAFRAFDLNFVRGLGIESNGFEISAEITYKTALRGGKIGEVEGKHGKRVRGKSSFNFRKVAPGYFRVFLKGIVARIIGKWI
jgi:dolichol-phosphate mannosyltransferase